jgi:hypothetical protein
MKTFKITARTHLLSITFTATLASSAEAVEQVAEMLGDTPFGITVTSQE